jgi:hypothetical protein
MKTKYAVIPSSAAMAALLLAGSMNSARALSATVIPNADHAFSLASGFQDVRWDKDKIEQFRQAYSLLEKTEHEYDGHRGEAMRALHKAADIQGFELRSREGGVDKDRRTSDARMQAALDILVKFQDPKGGKEQEHLNHAIKELKIALGK